jgi:hypothetical protein
MWIPKKGDIIEVNVNLYQADRRRAIIVDLYEAKHFRGGVGMSIRWLGGAIEPAYPGYCPDDFVLVNGLDRVLDEI